MKIHQPTNHYLRTNNSPDDDPLDNSVNHDDHPDDSSLNHDPVLSITELLNENLEEEMDDSRIETIHTSPLTLQPSQQHQ